MNARHWFLQLLIALDQLANVLITPLHGGAWADETLSSRAWRMERKGRPWGRICRPVIDGVFRLLGQRGHCRQAFLAEREQRQLPPEARGDSGMNSGVVR